jgi:hypothetical protein
MIDRASGLCDGQEKYVEGFDRENLKQEDHLGNLHTDGMIIIKGT